MTATPGQDREGWSRLDIVRVPYDHPDAVELTELVQDYYRQVYGGPDDSPVSVDEFAPPIGDFRLGYLEHRAVVMGGWRFVPGVGPEGALRPVELKRMFVRPEVRDRGLARQMLVALERSARAAGADWSLLQTGRPQVPALHLYRRAGYSTVTPFGHFAGMSDAVHLGRRLVPDEDAPSGPARQVRPE